MANISNELKKRCNVCGKLRSPNSFYVSRSEYHADGRLPICKKCYLEKSMNDDQTDIDLERFQKLLQQCDKPFIAKIYKSAVSQTEYKHPDKQGADKVETAIGYYMKNLNGLYQYQNKGWESSKFDDAEETTDTNSVVVSEDGYEYSTEQFDAVLALFKYLLSVYKFRKGTEDYELLKIYAALRLRAEAAAAENDPDQHFQLLTDCGDILTTLHWEE